MVKRVSKPIFLRTFLFVVLFLLVEAGVFIFLSSPGSITGQAIGDFSGLYEKFYPNSKNFLIIQWSVIAVLIIFVYLKNAKIHRRNKQVSKISLGPIMKQSKTNLDALYLVLQKEKSLDIKSISSLFDIPGDLAMEWARVLESGDLVTIDYPGFGSPIVRLVEANKSKVKGDEEDISTVTKNAEAMVEKKHRSPTELLDDKKTQSFHSVANNKSVSSTPKRNSKKRKNSNTNKDEKLSKKKGGKTKKYSSKKKKVSSKKSVKGKHSKKSKKK